MLVFLIVTNLTLMAAVFGYALSASMVAHPAMMVSKRETAVDYFSPFFHKSAHLLLVLSLLVLALSLIISSISTNWLWTIGAVILQLSGPYTLKILMPVNNRIMAEGVDIHSQQMTKDLSIWGKLHLPRTVLAASVFVFFAYLAITL